MVLIRWYRIEENVLLLTDSILREGGLRTVLKGFNIEARRVSYIFEKPQFVVDGARISVSLYVLCVVMPLSGYSASDLKQGAIGNCWYISALGSVATKPDLLKKLCVAVSQLKHSLE